MGTLHIKKADVRDAQILSTLIRKSFKQQADELQISGTDYPGYVAFESTEMAQERLQRTEVYLLLEHGTPIGTIGFSQQGQTGFIERLAVIPEHRGHQYGQVLLRYAEAELYGMGCTKIHLTIVAGFLRLRAYYENLGYSHYLTKPVPSLPFEVAYLSKRISGINQFRDRRISYTFSEFIQDLKHILHENIVSVYTYGSVLSDDLCPGYGDLDFLVIVKQNLSNQEMEKLIEQRVSYRNEYISPYFRMLEDAFLPQAFLCRENGTGLWWGTKGERLWTENQLDPFTMYTLRKQGLLIYGEPQHHLFPDLSRETMVSFLHDFLICMRTYGKGGSLHSIDWLLLTAKFMCWFKEGEIVSKSQAADWGLQHIKGQWKEQLPLAKELRKYPEKIKQAEYASWISNLGPVIREAAVEFEKLLLGCIFIFVALVLTGEAMC